jgi:serine protein kinase
MQEILLNAAQDERYEGLSALAVLDQLERLIERTTVYDFLTLEVDQGYHDHGAFISVIRDRYLDRVDNEVRAAMGLVSEAQYVDLFTKYILHVSYTLKNERIYHEATGRKEDPDTGLMERLEAIWDAPSDREGFRRDLIGRVGAWRIDFPGGEINYRRLFPKLFDALEADYFRQQKDTISALAKKALDVLVSEASDETPTPNLSTDDVKAVQAFIGDMTEHHGYSRPLVRDALGALVRFRYA